jgi:serine/threonine-protein kinase
MALLNAERWGRPAIPAGTRIGRYLMGEKLAEGGMAEVYCAIALGAQGFAKEVVLKIVLPALAQDEEFIEMFIAEARLASKLTHPNIVETFDFGEHEGRYFIAMEYVRGVSLWRLRSRCRKLNLNFPPLLAAAICADVAKALQHAHSLREGGQVLNVVHRDVTPHNVLLSVDGAVKLSDFGIAKVGTSHTRPGILKGKFPYMSPEQARGESVDGRTDIFALGILLWELLAGRRLFTGESDLEVLRAVQLGPIASPRGFGAEHVPEELAAIAMKALVRPLAARLQTAAELERELRGFVLANAKCIEDTSVAQFLRATFPPQDEFRSPIQPSTAEPEAAPAPEPVVRPTAPMPGLPPSPKREWHAPNEGKERPTMPALALLEEGIDTDRLPNGRWAWGSLPESDRPSAGDAVCHSAQQELPSESRPTLMADAFPRLTNQASASAESRPTVMGDAFPLLAQGATRRDEGAGAARATSRVTAEGPSVARLLALSRRHAVAIGALLALGAVCVLGAAMLSQMASAPPVPTDVSEAAARRDVVPQEPPSSSSDEQRGAALSQTQSSGHAAVPNGASSQSDEREERLEELVPPPVRPERPVVPSMGRLTVHAIPFARVTVRGKSLGEVLGTKTFRLAPGTYEVQLTHLTDRVVRSVTIRGGAESHVELNASR